MLINRGNLDVVFAGYKSIFNDGFARAPSNYQTVAMEVPSTTGTEVYGWLGMFPKIREWVDERYVRNLMANKWRIDNRLFELTICVRRVDIEDDNVGLYKPFIDEMGRDSKQHPDELCFDLLKDGFNGLCYDGKPFFANDHPVRQEGSSTLPASNMQPGSGPAWFLIDASRAVRPLIWQLREPYEFVALTDPYSETVFFRDEFIYGVRARANAGFGLWQLAFGSKAPLNAANYEAARKAMNAVTSDFGRKLNIRPTHLVCGTLLEGDARRLLNNGDRIEVMTIGETQQAVPIANEWAGTVELIVTSHLD